MHQLLSLDDRIAKQRVRRQGRPDQQRTGPAIAEYEADTDRLEAAHKAGHALATEILHSYAQAEFFTQLPDVDETVQVVTYVVAVGDVSTDLLSPGSDAHSRSDRQLHGCYIATSDGQENMSTSAWRAMAPTPKHASRPAKKPASYKSSGPLIVEQFEALALERTSARVATKCHPSRR